MQPVTKKPPERNPHPGNEQAEVNEDEWEGPQTGWSREKHQPDKMAKVGAEANRVARRLPVSSVRPVNHPRYQLSGCQAASDHTGTKLGPGHQGALIRTGSGDGRVPGGHGEGAQSGTPGVPPQGGPDGPSWMGTGARPWVRCGGGGNRAAGH